MRSVGLIGLGMSAVVLFLAACTAEPSPEQNHSDANLTSYNAVDSANYAGASTTTDQSEQVVMNSWDIDGSAAPPAITDQGAAPTKVDVEDLHSAYRSNAVAALNKYGSGPFLVTGQVKGVGEELGKMMVHFHTNDDAVLSDFSGAESIKPYETVTLLCGGVKSYGTFLELEDCAVHGT